MSEQEQKKRKSAKQAVAEALAEAFVVAEPETAFEKNTDEESAAKEINGAESPPKDPPPPSSEQEADSPSVRGMPAEPAGDSPRHYAPPPSEKEAGSPSLEGMPAEDSLRSYTPPPSEKEAEQLAAEKEQLLQQHLRLQADFDNFRRRSRQEREDVLKMANAALIQGLLPVLDNFELALRALPESAEREGIQLIQRQMLDALAIAGLTPIEAIGEDFDPQFHEAILQSDAGPEQKGKVLGEAQKGYMLGGKLLRASRVFVGS